MIDDQWLTKFKIDMLNKRCDFNRSFLNIKKLFFRLSQKNKPLPVLFNETRNGLG